MKLDAYLNLLPKSKQAQGPSNFGDPKMLYQCLTYRLGISIGAISHTPLLSSLILPEEGGFVKHLPLIPGENRAEPVPRSQLVGMHPRKTTYPKVDRCASPIRRQILD